MSPKDRDIKRLAQVALYMISNLLEIHVRRMSRRLGDAMRHFMVECDYGAGRGPFKIPELQTARELLQSEEVCVKFSTPTRFISLGHISRTFHLRYKFPQAPLWVLPLIVLYGLTWL